VWIYADVNVNADIPNPNDNTIYSFWCFNEVIKKNVIVLMINWMGRIANKKSVKLNPTL